MAVSSISPHPMQIPRGASRLALIKIKKLVDSFHKQLLAAEHLLVVSIGIYEGAYVVHCCSYIKVYDCIRVMPSSIRRHPQHSSQKRGNFVWSAHCRLTGTRYLANEENVSHWSTLQQTQRVDDQPNLVCPPTRDTALLCPLSVLWPCKPHFHRADKFLLKGVLPSQFRWWMDLSEIDAFEVLRNNHPSPFQLCLH